jgi:hypothetical protein
MVARAKSPKQIVKYPSEYYEQCQYFALVKYNYKRFPELRLAFGTMNGVPVSIGLAVKMQKAGNIPGVPDIVLPIARGEWHGLMIEMKRQKGGSVSPAQDKYHDMLFTAGYKVIVARGYRGAFEETIRYLQESI